MKHMIGLKIQFKVILSFCMCFYWNGEQFRLKFSFNLIYIKPPLLRHKKYLVSSNIEVKYKLIHKCFSFV
jgi:hypothetical protein